MTSTFGIVMVIHCLCAGESPYKDEAGVSAAAHLVVDAIQVEEAATCGCEPTDIDIGIESGLSRGFFVLSYISCLCLPGRLSRL